MLKPTIQATLFAGVLMGCVQADPAAQKSFLAPAPAEAELQAVPTSAAPMAQATAIQDGTILAEIAASARSVSDAASSVQGRLQENRLALETFKYDRFPQIVPRGRLPIDGGDPSVGVGIRQTVIDGGRHRMKRAQYQVQIRLAEIALWEERNTAVFEALSQYVEAVRFVNLGAANAEAVAQHLALRDMVEKRQLGGISDRGELDLVDIAIGDLRSTGQLDRSALRTAIAQLAILAGPPPPDVGTRTVESLAAMVAPVGDVDASPTLRSADGEIDLAVAETAEIKTTRFPGLVLEGFVDRRDGQMQPGFGLNLSTDAFSALSHGSKVSAAEAHEGTARSAYDRQVRQVQLELDRLDLVFANLTSNAAEYRRQEARADASVALFLDQFAAGARPLLDALRVYERSMSVQRKRIDAEADALLNRLDRARMLGALAPRTEA